MVRRKTPRLQGAMTEIIPKESPIFLPVDGPGRRFVTNRFVRLGDVDPSDELRFDAIGRYGQDVANDDAREVDLLGALHFVVRKTVVVVHQPGVFRELVTSTTFCNGTGGRWAERQTAIRGDAGASIDISSVWVHIDPDSGRPKKLDDRFHNLYDESARGRKANTKLHHSPAVADNASAMAWPFRWSDLDLLGHVNNAAFWTAVEQVVHVRGIRRTGITAQLEFRQPVPPDTTATLHWSGDVAAANGLMIWLTGENSETFATARLSSAMSATPAAL